MQICMGILTAGNLRKSLANGRGPIRKYNRALLVDSLGNPLSIRDLRIGRNYVFHYPYVTTPCFLIDLGKAIEESVTLYTRDGEAYEWTGGIGDRKSIVAFSAICAHKMTHPAKSVSFINYRHERISYRNKQNQQGSGSQLIYCCSERSVYDPRSGARVLGGPADQPLTTVLLDHNAEQDRVYAVGTLGGELYARFFEKFTPRLQLEYLITDVDRLVDHSTEVLPLEVFSRTQMRC